LWCGPTDCTEPVGPSSAGSSGGSGSVSSSSLDVKDKKPAERLTALKAADKQIQSSLSSAEKRYIILYDDKITTEHEDKVKYAGGSIHKKFDMLPGMVVSLNEEDIPSIKLQENVIDVYEDTRVFAQLSESVPQINADLVHSKL